MRDLLENFKNELCTRDNVDTWQTYEILILLDKHVEQKLQ